jgi:hypothetical protein
VSPSSDAEPQSRQGQDVDSVEKAAARRGRHADRPDQPAWEYRLMTMAVGEEADKTLSALSAEGWRVAHMLEVTTQRSPGGLLEVLLLLEREIF